MYLLLFLLIGALYYLVALGIGIVVGAAVALYLLLRIGQWFYYRVLIREGKGKRRRPKHEKSWLHLRFDEWQDNWRYDIEMSMLQKPRGRWKYLDSYKNDRAREAFINTYGHYTRSTRFDKYKRFPSETLPPKVQR